MSVKLFRTIAAEIEQKYPEVFLTSSIHDHYYIYHDGSGSSFRINATSDLPSDIKNKLTEAFKEVTQAKDSWLMQSGE